MRAKETAKMIGGSVVVYVIMAACSAASGPQSTSPADGGQAQGDGANGGMLTNPVADAMAAVNQSGTRLKAKYYAGADGSKQFIGLHDSQRNEDCSFTTAADGVLRCLPSGTSPALHFFADAACAKPIAAVSWGCAVGAYALVVDNTASGCGTQTRVLTIGSSFSGPDVYVSSSSTNCFSATTASYAGSFNFYTVVAEVPASSFVQATVQTEP